MNMWQHLRGFLRLDGTRPMTGDLNVDSNPITGVKTIKDETGNTRLLFDTATPNLYIYDDAGNIRFIALASTNTGDLQFRALDGATNTLVWDESDSRWEFAARPYSTADAALLEVEGHTHAGGGGLTLLDTDTLVSAAANIEIGSISADYTDLIIQATLRSDVSATSDNVQLNVGATAIDTGANYTYSLERAGTATGVANASGATKIESQVTLIGDTATAGLESIYRIEIHDYASTSRWRLFSWQGYRSADGNYIFEKGNAVWRNAAAAIDIVRLTPKAGSNFVAGSEVRIWGI